MTARSIYILESRGVTDIVFHCSGIASRADASAGLSRRMHGSAQSLLQCLLAQ